MKTCETNYVNPLYPDKITEFESLKTILYKKKVHFNTEYFNALCFY